MISGQKWGCLTEASSVELGALPGPLKAVNVKWTKESRSLRQLDRPCEHYLPAHEPYLFSSKTLLLQTLLSEK